MYSQSCVRSDRLHVELSAPLHPPHPRWTHAEPDHGGAQSARSLPTNGSAAEDHMDTHYLDYNAELMNSID